MFASRGMHVAKKGLLGQHQQQHKNEYKKNEFKKGYKNKCKNE